MNPACRLCAAPLTRTFVDLGMSPPCESYLRPDQLDEPETTYSLHVRICERCLLVQLPAHVAAEEIFTADYAYFSSYSDSWVAHAGRFVDDMAARLGLGAGSFVVEAASNDGYLLQHAVARGIRVLGVEPCGGVADAARALGVPTESVFLGERTGTEIAERHGPADLVVANNVLAHVPDLLDFVRGLRALVADGGTVSLEFPHLLRLIEGRQYDTIYHEHYSYFTLRTAAAALAAAGLAVVDVEELSTHGGSLRVLARPGEQRPSEMVEKVLADERAAGLHTVEGHTGFAQEVFEVKAGLLEFLLTAAREGRSVAGYGAPGKGNTLLNHCGVREDLLPFTVDRNPHKHGMHLPGTHIPVHPPERLAEVRPDYILILPWNLRAEIAQQIAYTREWGARLVVPIPRLEFV
ncbi:methyltransferase family protein [Pseudonocardia hierapolitana]|uniref:Methyltransferase family protein n=1 Tax=Pseudonocardia hierapolitana TaxID=1128676 RepID=A0A561SVW6_9PSEU|nr:class I SAM-dependent methyltransferase [Pseudonocardia hierapolitana]TWF78981.1 methyltransferase family protein [Pseudonocardia hierapolitana]